MAMQELLSHEEYRRDSYKLLSECFYLPDRELIEMLNDLDGSRGGLYGEITMSIPQLSEVESLRIDYARLFLGPFRVLAPPYGSVYLEDPSRLMTDSTVGASNAYREEGLGIGLQEAPDHIAVELEFMYFLVFREIEGIRDANSERVIRYLERQRLFLGTHLGIWVSRFADSVEANAGTEFYRNLARSTRSFVKEDHSSLTDTSIYFLSPQCAP
jgi:TorA maturation chaperone TorD